MDRCSYYDVAGEDLKFLEFYYSRIDEAPNYNPVVVQEQQIVEKLLKHLIDRFADSSDALGMLRSHKLAQIAGMVNTICGLGINLDDMRFLSEFYFDGRYPSRDYLAASKEDAARGYQIVREVKAAVDGYILKHAPAARITSF